MKKSDIFIATGILLFLSAVLPDDLFAIQAHGGNEGIMVHQLGHVFFLVSMGVFVYWLREGQILADAGWRYIMWFALFMGAWNLDVIAMHFLDEQAILLNVIKTGPWTVIIQSKVGAVLSVFYYLGKLDHLICVPALFFLYLGLKRILSELESFKSGKEIP
ncbi:MAG: hypothetical protein M0Z56_03970 [Desulfobacteraceae bacterium]|nr:hypothetical protein [Desulfobacteraceae bacterium]